ncbi:hypothetical protein [Cryptosporangium sp. NPDC048952]|uniref:hypothetical protein n=1 Tax=Cryptosporangium sp. NPDC048952 TaxID=3363961 RepID=UPI0037128544
MRRRTPTNIGANAGSPADLERVAPYGQNFNNFMSDVMESAMSGEPADPREVADVFVSLVEMPDGTRPRRTIVGPPPVQIAVRAASTAADEATHAVATGMGTDSHLS